jgi:AraC-like DNA-binding protein
MILTRTLLEYAGVTVADVACRHPAGRGAQTEPSTGYGLVFVRRGCFVRHAEGGTEVLDPTAAFARRPGQEQRYDHPTVGGDDCTAMSFDETVAAALWGDEPDLPEEPLPISPRLDLAHRRLLAEARRGADPDALYERTLNLAAAALAQRHPHRVLAGRPGTRRGRRQLVRDAREALATAPERPLPALARELGVSPHHLSRIFHAHTGHTIAQHRLRLRCRAALQRIAAGEDSLARLAAEVGFADQSHLTRAIRRQTGYTPTQLRRLLGYAGEISGA